MPLKGKENIRNGVNEILALKESKFRGAMITTFSNIVIETPVDTGRARANWFLTVGQPSTEITNSVTLSGEADNVPKKPFGKKTFFTNNMPYIETLEFGRYPGLDTEKVVGGFSRMAPKGWVRKHVRLFFKAIKKL